MSTSAAIGADGRGLTFILSAPRAGSTLLAAILACHSRILCPPEPWFLLPLVKMATDDVVVTAAYDTSLATQAIAGLIAPALRDEAMRAYARTVYESLLRENARQLFVDKTPRYYQICERLAEVFPGAIHLWLKRNPLDVIASMKSTWGLSIAELTGQNLSPYTFDAMLSHTLLAEHFIHTSVETVELRYEDLVADPATSVARVCRALGVDFEPAMVDYGENRSVVEAYSGARMGDRKLLDERSPHAASVGRWRSILEPSEVAACVAALGSATFMAEGYDDVLLDACEYAAFDPSDITLDGRVTLVREAYVDYARQVVLSGADRRRVEKPAGIEHTVLGQQNLVLQREADERLEVIRRLDTEVRVLRERTHVADILREVESEIAQQGRVVAQLQVAVASQQATLTQIESAAALFAERLEHVELADRAAAAASATPAIDPAWAAERRALQLAHEQAEAAAEARLRVIQEQELALRRYRRWHVREILSTWTAPRIGQLYQYGPRPLRVPNWYVRRPTFTNAPTISIVTPSLNQGAFIDHTICSVLDQQYPALEYIIQDAKSSDETLTILDRYKPFLTHVASEFDSGLANGINKGFVHASGQLMAYLNSDDLLLPGALHYVAKYFMDNPRVDVVYGHRVVIDEYESEIGRWVLPPHDDEVLSWADYVPQETLFWRRTAWDKIGGSLDETFSFAVDWDLLIRFRDSGATMRRLPRFLGAFRVHPHQKTSAELLGIGVSEMNRLRERCHGRRVLDVEIQRGIQRYLRRHVVYHKLYRLGLLRY
jgi:glycosyltransferase involved in cell wall biosynthesis/uncharacterized coiled-coil protein SlyX